MTDQELRDLIAKTTKLALENTEAIAELRESQKQTDKQIEKTDRQIKQTNKQLGELGNKFGSYTEGLAGASLERIFRRKFNLEHTMTNARSRKNGETMEIDMLAYSNSTENIVFAAEIKNHFQEKHLEQILQMLRDFPKFFPEHKDKKLYGIVAAVQVPENLRRELAQNGIYLVIANHNNFRLTKPEDFIEKQYNEDINVENQQVKATQEETTKSAKYELPRSQETIFDGPFINTAYFDALLETFIIYVAKAENTITFIRVLMKMYDGRNTVIYWHKDGFGKYGKKFEIPTIKKATQQFRFWKRQPDAHEFIKQNTRKSGSDFDTYFDIDPLIKILSDVAQRWKASDYSGYSASELKDIPELLKFFTDRYETLPKIEISEDEEVQYAHYSKVSDSKKNNR